MPKSNLDYWEPKLARTVERDARNDAALRELGWKVIAIWECELEPFGAPDEFACQIHSTLKVR